MNEFRLLISYINGAVADATIALRETHNKNYAVARTRACSAAVNVVEALRIINEMNDKLRIEDEHNDDLDKNSSL